MAAELTGERNAVREAAPTSARATRAPFARERGAKKSLPLETLGEAPARGMGAGTARGEFDRSGLGRLSATNKDRRDGAEE